MLLYLPALSGDNKSKEGEKVVKCKVHIVLQQKDVMCMSQATACNQKSVLSWQYWEISARGKPYFTDLQVNA